MDLEKLLLSEGRSGYLKPELITEAVARGLATETAAKKMLKPALVKLLVAALSKSKKPPAGKKTGKGKAVTKKKVIEGSPLEFLSPAKEPHPEVKAPPLPAKGEEIVEKVIAASKLKLLPHQVRVVKHLQVHPGVIAHWEPGAGKTLLAAAASAAYLEGGKNRQVVVLLPKTLRGNFEKGLRAYGFSASKIKSKFTFYGFVEYYNRYVEKEVPTKNYMLIIDEAQNLRKIPKTGKKTKRQSGKGSKGALEASKHADKVLILTGGAYYNSPYDLEMMMALVRKREPISKKAFMEKTATPESTKRYAKCAIDFYWGQKKDYPSVEIHPVPIKMTRKQYEEYSVIDEKYRKGSEEKWVDPKTNKLVTEFKQPMWVANMRSEVNSLFECPKCDWVMERLKKGNQSLVYSFFKKTGIDLLKKRCDAAGITYLEINGSTPKKPTRNGKPTVQDIVDAYNAAEVQVLFVTKAGVEGLDLKNTLDVIVLEANFNESTDNQLIARAARYKSHEGSKVKHVDVWFLSLSKPDFAEKQEDPYIPSIDDRLFQLIGEKSEGQRETYAKFEGSSISAGKCPHAVGAGAGGAKAWSAVSPTKSELLKATKEAEKAAKAKARAEKAAKAKAAKAKKPAKNGAKKVIKKPATKVAKKAAVKKTVAKKIATKKVVKK